MIAEVVRAWAVKPDDRVLRDGQVCKVNATARLGAKTAKSLEIIAWSPRAGCYKRFRVRPDDLIARVTGQED